MCESRRAALSVALPIAILVSCALVVPSTAIAADPRQELAFPDIPGYQTLVCDFHTHTIFSDGYVWPTVRVDEAWREGLDVLALTDHVEYQPHKGDVPTNLGRPYELASERARQLGLVLIRGAEITRDTPPGHHNALFVTDIAALDTKPNEAVKAATAAAKDDKSAADAARQRATEQAYFAAFDAAAAQHAFCFWNHPGWQGQARGPWDDWQQKLLEKKQLHGIEICNGPEYFEYAHRLAEEKGLTLLGNSDTHEPSRGLREYKEGHRTLTLVFAKTRDEAGVREALFAGRTAVWWKDRLIGREAELAPLIAASMVVHPIHYRTADKAWLRIENRGEVELVLERNKNAGKACEKAANRPAEQSAGQPAGKAPRTGEPAQPDTWSGPADITVPAHGTALLRLELTKPQNDKAGSGEAKPGADRAAPALPPSLPYTIRNVLTGPDSPLPCALILSTE